MAWWNTFYCTGGVGEVTILKVAPFYKIKYVPTEPDSIMYVRPLLQKVEYLGNENKIELEYRPSEKKILVSYIEPTTIKIKLLCK